ncbi:MAG: tyrosine--tRNA ligase [Sphingomonadaceae bacterium]|nr:tyrosine--tRNA ligase [Sphingomonadaceae bacterium]
MPDTASILPELDWRGLFADCTDRAAVERRVAEGPLTLYCGFDPTSDSLHVGNLVPLLSLRRFQIAGHHPIALAGGSTGMIGDPSGKSDERSLLTPDQLAHNLECIKPQLERFLDFSTTVNPARIVNNYDWTATVPVLDFLRDVGKHITVNSMVAKDSVRARMEDRTSGISFTEFSYMLLQGFDFYHLRKTYNCELQIGATDQWGNITVGTELTRKKLGATVWGLVFPLLEKADGTKYGKTAEGAVWLDAKKTSPYRFYQFFMNADDADVVKLIKMLTFVPADVIAGLEMFMAEQPEARHAQRLLAHSMTTLVHGATATTGAEAATAVLFSGTVDAIDAISEEAFGDVVGEVPTSELPRARFEAQGLPIVDVVVHAGLAASKSEGRRAVETGGVYLNNVRVDRVNEMVTTGDLLFGKYVLLRKGKRNYAVIHAR